VPAPRKKAHPQQDIKLIDYGGGIQAIAWDSVNGTSKVLFDVKRSMTPTDKAKFANDVANRAQDARQFERKQALEESKFEQGKIDSAADRVLKGKRIEYQQADKKAGREIEILNSEISDLNKQIEAVEKNYILTPEQRAEELAKLEPERAKLREKREKLINEKQTADGEEFPILTADNPGTETAQAEPADDETPVMRNSEGHELTKKDIELLISLIGKDERLNEAGVKTKEDLLKFIMQTGYSLINQ